MNARDAYSISEVSSRLGISQITIWRKIKAGDIKAVHVGSRVIVSHIELQRLVAEGTRPNIVANENEVATFDHPSTTSRNP